jgi:serine/threonine protein kinase
MDYIKGKDLDSLVEESGPLSCADVKRILADVTSALKYIHGHNIIHRCAKNSASV